MTTDNLYTVNTGTVTTGDVLTFSDSSSTWSIASTIKMQITKTPIHIPAKRAVQVKKGFWDDVEWKEYTSYFPRKSITGKIIIGKMHKRWRTPEPKMRGQGLGIFKEFAKTKELFEEKLKGKA